MNKRITFDNVERQPLPRSSFDHRLTLTMPRLPQRTVTSESLFLGTTEIGIEHAGSLYRLKITRQGKLILNK